LRVLLISAALLLASPCVLGAEADDAAAEDAQATEAQAAEAQVTEAQVTEAQGDGIEQPKTLSGISILGNEEAPKSLVIVPWKASELGENISLTDTLDERARPVDREVFERELSFYEIRAAE